MGAIYSMYDYLTGKSDVPNPVTGLTERERLLIVNSWRSSQPKMVDNGVALLIRYFENHPDHKKYFPFRDQSLSELPDNARFRAHASAIMYQFTSIVDHLDQPDILVAILHKIGESHKPRNIPVIGFKYLHETLLELQEPQWTKPVAAAWKKALTVAFSQIEQAFERA